MGGFGTIPIYFLTNLKGLKGASIGRVTKGYLLIKGMNGFKKYSQVVLTKTVNKMVILCYITII